MATVIDTAVLAKVVAAALIAGIGMTAIFSLVIYGSTRFDDLRRSGKSAGAVVFAVLAGLGVAAFLGGCVLGIVVMTRK